MRFLGGCLLWLICAGCGSESDAPVQPRRREQENAGVAPSTPRYPKLAIIDTGAPSDLADVEITLQRTSCYGWCPSYILTLHGNGSGSWLGRLYVKYVGERDFEFEPEVLRDVLDRFERLDFLAVQHVDSWMVEDGGSEILTLKIGTRTRSFTNDFNGTETLLEREDARFHAELTGIAKLIVARVDAEKWIGTEAERERLR